MVYMYNFIQKIRSNVCTSKNCIPVLLFCIGVCISVIVPYEIDKISTDKIKESYTVFVHNTGKSIRSVINASSSSSVLTEVMGTYNVSESEFSIFAEASDTIHDIGSMFYVVKILPSEIKVFEERASDDLKNITVVDNTFSPIYNYTEEYLWPVLYEYFPGGVDGTEIDFRGLNMYSDQLKNTVDDMVSSRISVYSDPILFLTNNELGLLLFRPVLREKESVSSFIIRGIKPSNFLVDVDLNELKDTFGADLTIYMERNGNSDILFGDGIQYMEKCQHIIKISSVSSMLVCISEIVYETKTQLYILIIGGGIIFSLLLALLLRTFQNSSENYKLAKTRSNLIAHISHELRTPVNSIMGISQMILSSVIEKEEIGQVLSGYLSSIIYSSKELVCVIDDVMEMSEIYANNVKIVESKINLRELIHRSVLETWESSNIEGIEKPILTLFILDSVPKSLVGSDKKKLSQIIKNLVSNSIKFTEKGTIDIIATTKNRRDGESLTFELSVSDTGVGINKEEINTIFEPFSSDHNSRVPGSGAGLGLSISKNFSKTLGGDIKCTSSIGKGTTFFFSCVLKICEDFMKGEIQEFIFPEEKDIEAIESIENVERTMVVRSKANGLEHSILIVDDIGLNRMVLSNMLKNMKVTTRTCNDGLDCIDLCKQEKFSVILMDIFMPKMDGISATKIIRNTNNPNKDTPIIFVSATVEDSYIKNCIKAGGNSFIRKPVTMENLYIELENVE